MVIEILSHVLEIQKQTVHHIFGLKKPKQKGMKKVCKVELDSYDLYLLEML